MGRTATPRTRGRQIIDILIASTERGWGGGEAQAAILAAGLRARGHACTIAAVDGALAQRLRVDGVDVLRLPGRRPTPAAIWRTRRMLSARAPQILHMNDSGAVAVAGLASVGLALAGRVASRRVLFPLRRPSLYRRVTDRIACVSSAVMRGCMDAGLDERSLRVVPDGVVLPPPATRERTSSPGEACLLSVGSLVRCKGHADSLRAARHMLADRPGVRWLIAGDGPDRARLEQLARELGVQQQVRFLGFREDVPELMQRADLFVHAATEEGLGSSILEAMARGLPAVVADGGGTGDLMPARPALPCGWAVPASDPEALAAAIGAALDDPAEAAMRGRRGAELVRDRFSADAMIEATLALYQEILQSGPTNR